MICSSGFSMISFYCLCFIEQIGWQSFHYSQKKKIAANMAPIVTKPIRTKTMIAFMSPFMLNNDP